MTPMRKMRSKAGRLLQARHVPLLAAAMLASLLAVGYLPPGTQSPDSGARAGAAGPLSSPGGKTNDGHALTAEEMKQAADRQAEPMIETLRSDPSNGGLLAEVAAIYHVAHQYRQAAGFYRRAVQLDPGNAAIRIKLASSLYRDGDADGAIAELHRALNCDPKNADALFDLGVIRLEGKGDRSGALAAWKRLLESNPRLSAERKATVDKLMAQASAMPADWNGADGPGSRRGPQPATH